MNTYFSVLAAAFSYCAMVASCNGPSANDVKALGEKIDALGKTCAAPTVYQEKPAASPLVVPQAKGQGIQPQ